MSVKINHLNNFYSDLLADEYKSLYFQAVNNLSNGIFTTTYQMTPGDNFNEQANLVCIAILTGCPELFCVGQQVEITYQNGNVILKFPNNYPNEDYHKLDEELQEVINEVVEEANKYEDEMEKIMFVNDYLCQNIEGQTTLTVDNGNAYGALVKHVGRCEGFAEAGKLILDRLGIESLICIGTVEQNNEEIPHEWNAIMYHGEYYGFDFAWNGSMTIEGVSGVVYTFLDNETMGKEHKPFHVYPISHNDEYLFWNMHNGNCEYLSELQNAEIISVDRGYFSVHHLLDIKFDEYQRQNELTDIVRSELSPFSIASSFNYVYRDKIDVLMVFYIN